MLKRKFVLLWLCSAVVVTLARILHAADLGYDIAIQIQGAQHLLEGKGLSVYSLAGEDDLAKPAKLITLAHFPAGYSLCAAALMSIGFSAGAVLKTCGAAGTILGWWGWGNLAYSFFGEGLKRGRSWRWAGFAIAISTPLLFTPSWQGTDIFLWAAVPWVLEWVVKASDEKLHSRLWFDFLAGALCGFCVWMRYASLFLVAYAGVLIFCQSKRYVKVLVRRWAVFAVGLLPLIVLQLYLNQTASGVEGKPGGIAVSTGPGALIQHFWEGLWSVTLANYAVVWWMPRKVLLLFEQPGEQAPWLLAVTFAILALLLFSAVKIERRGLTAAARDIRTAAVGLFVIMPMFLYACAILGQVYVRIPRYYIPLLPLAIFVAYAFAVSEPKHASKMQALVRIVSVAYLAGYLFMAGVGVILLVLPGEKGSGRRVKFLSTSELRPWPSTKVTYEFSAARRYVLALLNEERGTVLVTNMEYWFYADSSVDRSRIRRLLGLRASYASGPARILIMAEERFEAPVDVLYLFSEGQSRRVNYFEGLPNLRLLRRFPEEHIKILEAHIPDGSRIPVKRQAAN